MTALMPYLISALLVVVAVCITAEVVSAIRDHGRPTAAEDGCCGCGAGTADVVLNCGEAYCWACIDAWPADAVPLGDLGPTVFPGHERTAR